MKQNSLGNYACDGLIRPTRRPIRCPVQLAQRLVGELQRAGKGDQLLAEGDLAQVAQTYSREMRKRRVGLELAVEDFCAPYRDQTRSLRK